MSVPGVIQPATLGMVREFFTASLIKRHYEKVTKGLGPNMVELLKKIDAIYYRLTEDDQATAPDVLVVDTPYKAVLSSRTMPAFVRPNEQTAALTAKQIAATTKFDKGLVDAAVLAGVIRPEQAAAISLPGSVSEFPLVSEVK